MAQAALQFVGWDARSAPIVGHRATDIGTQRDAVVFQLVTDLAGFAALEGEWNALHKASAEPHQIFQTFAWNRLWCRHYLPAGCTPGPQLAVVTGRQSGRLVLMLPLVVERVAGLRQLGWMGDPVTQYGDALAAAEARSAGVMRAAWRFAATATRADVASLRKVRADAVASAGLEGLGGSVVARQEAPHAALSGHQRFASYEALLSVKGRKNRRRHMRRLQELGPVAFASPKAGEAGPLVEQAIALKRKWLASKGLVSRAFADDRFVRFFVEAATTSAQDTGCRIDVLCSGDATAAIEISLEGRGSRFLHIGVYDAAFEKLGVGGLLLEHSLREGLSQGTKVFDLLAPKHDYKMEFCTATTEVRDYALAFTWRGRIYLNTWLGARAHLKRLVECAPAPLRRLAARLLAPPREGTS